MTTPPNLVVVDADDDTDEGGRQVDRVHRPVPGPDLAARVWPGIGCSSIGHGIGTDRGHRSPTTEFVHPERAGRGERCRQSNGFPHGVRQHRQAISFNKSSEKGDTGFTIGQIGVGFTLPDSAPLYLEGFLGRSRYDPRSTFTQGAERSVLPTKWSTVASTIGVGWDVPIAPNLVLRRILNGSLGHMETNASIAAHVLSHRYGDQVPELHFLDRGRLNTIGLSGSLMLDYMLTCKAYEIDVELRYTHLIQQIFDALPGVRGSSESVTLELWSRVRWPSLVEVAGLPVRWVLEGSYSYFFGTQQNALGFDWLAKIGGGIEFDLSRHEIGVFGFNAQRVRVLGRYVFGNGVNGESLGLAVSFWRLGLQLPVLAGG